MNNKFNYLLIPALIISIIGNIFFYFEINDLKKEIQAGNQSLTLIDNDYTKIIGEIPDGWKTYKNDKYGFVLNYPESFDSQKIEIKEMDFNNENDFISKQKKSGVSNNVFYTFGTFKTTKNIIDFNIPDNNQTRKSVFAIAIHPNDSNIPFKDFISQEILSTPEGIENQQIVKINNVEGYRIITPATEPTNTSSIIYYLPAKDKKTIISIGAPIEIFKYGPPPGEPPFARVNAFIKLYPQYQSEIKNIENLYMNDNKTELAKKYPDFIKYEVGLAITSTEKELDERLTLEKIAYSLKIN